MAILPLGAVVLLLHCDDGSTSTTLADATQYAQTAKCYGTCAPSSAQSMFGGSSVKTGNANGNFFAVGTNQTMDFGTADFTIEGFVYPVSQGADGGAILGRWDGTNNDFLLARNADGSMGVYLNGSLVLTTSAGDLPLNTWTHIALVRSTGTVYAYIGGTGKGNAAFAAAINCTHGVPLYFGQANQSGGATWLESYYDEIRVSNGLAQYSGNFTPPAAPFGGAQVPDTQISLLMHCDGTAGSGAFADSSTYTHGITGSALVDAGSKFGSGAAKFSASGDYLSVGADATLNLGTGDFTIEFWVNPTGSVPNGFAVMMDWRPSGTTGQYPTIYMYSGMQVVFFQSEADRIVGPALSANTWTHIAVCRYAGTTTLYVNGASAGTYNDSNNYGVGSVVTLGKAGRDGNGQFYGSMDEIRVSKGIARYTGPFTPPNAPFTGMTTGQAADPNFSNVAVLLHFDGTSGSTAFSDSGPNGLQVAASGSAAVSNAQTKFGSGALALNGSSAVYGQSYESSLNVNTPNTSFTVECWVYLTTTSGDPYLVTANSSGNSPRWAMQIQNGHVAFYSGGSGAPPQGTAIVPTNQWVHLAVCYDSASGVLRTFVGGVQDYSGTGAVNTATTPMRLELGAAYFNNSNFANGYIDEVRITKGVARYLANFTPPTSAFPDSTGAVPVDPNFSNVALLLHGDGADNGSVFTDSSNYAHGLAIGGSPKTSTTAPKFGSASIAFAGTGNGNDQPGATVDYLDLAADSSTALGTSDFTIETWVKLNAIPSSYGAIFDCRPASTNGLYPALFVQNNGTLLYYTNGLNTLSSSAALSTGVWTHVALVRRSGVLTIYINGTSSGTYNDSNNYVNNRMRIGGSGYGNYLGLNGNLDEFRFTPGVARYTGNFTPPTAAFPDGSSGGDPYGSNVSLLLHCDGSNGSNVFVDSSSYAQTVLANGAVSISTTGAKFGSGCCVTTGVYADYLSVANGAQFDFGNGDFTVEGWLQLTSVGTNGAAFIGRWGGAPSNMADWLIYLDTSNRLIIYLNGQPLATAGSPVPTDGNYHHIAMVRSGNTVTMYMDGVSVCSSNFTASVQYSPSKPVRTHVWDDTNGRLNGKIDEIRITKGVARYTGNFTPPSSAFPNPPVVPVVQKPTKLSSSSLRMYKQIRPLAPSGTKRLFRVHRVTDFYNGGAGTISGKVTVNDNPDSRKVRLYDLRSGQLLRTTWSAADGSYKFTGIAPGLVYFVVGHDHTKTYNAVVQDMVKPV